MRFFYLGKGVGVDDERKIKLILMTIILYFSEYGRCHFKTDEGNI